MVGVGLPQGGVRHFLIKGWFRLVRIGLQLA